MCRQVWPSAASLPRVFGFTSHSSAVERSIERRFLVLPSPARARDVHAYLTAEPHVAGSRRDLTLAQWIRDRWREDGLDSAEIIQHDVLLPYATEVVVEMTSPRRWRASLHEDPVPGDPSTMRDTGVAYHAYSASGDVNARVVFVDSGNPADYDRLEGEGD